MAIQTVGVVGTGVIGASWVGLFLAKGLKVLVSDPAPGAEQKLAEHLKTIWPVLEKLGLEPGASLSNYQFVGPSLQGHYDKVDFIQENAPEKKELKTTLIGEIDAGTRPDVVIASSSSGLPSSQFIGKATKNPGRVLIGHPFNPPHIMPLVEVVPNPKTDSKTIDTTLSFYNSLGHRAVLIKKEIPGHVTNRLQAALNTEAYSLVSRGIISAQDLDACVTSSLGPRWAVTGPLVSNALGGGTGSGGFKHLLEHLGPSTQVWIDDMRAHAFPWDAESINSLTDSVNAELSGHDLKDIEENRDDHLVRILQLDKK